MEYQALMLLKQWTCPECGKQIWLNGIEPNRDVDVLRHLYEGHQLSSCDIAELLDMPLGRVGYNMQQGGIKNRSSSEAAKLRHQRKGAGIKPYARLEVICEWCNKKIVRARSTIHKHNFCGDKCHREWEKASAAEWIDLKCANCGKAIRKKEYHVLEHNFCNHECQYEFFIGENNHQWKGGRYVGKLRRQERKWAIAIWKRANSQCELCGKQVFPGSNAGQSHHILGAASFPQFVLESSNGVYLCWECHREKVHNKTGYKAQQAILDLIHWEDYHNGTGFREALSEAIFTGEYYSAL